MPTFDFHIACAGDITARILLFPCVYKALKVCVLSWQFSNNVHFEVEDALVVKIELGPLRGNVCSQEPKTLEGQVRGSNRLHGWRSGRAEVFDRHRGAVKEGDERPAKFGQVFCFDGLPHS